LYGAGCAKCAARCTLRASCRHAHNAELLREFAARMETVKQGGGGKCAQRANERTNERTREPGMTMRHLRGECARAGKRMRFAQAARIA
jgi:hypothetical protein